MTQRSPLHAVHQELGARFVDFGGWSMPVQYDSVLAEHAAVREAVGVFDVSHLGRARVAGPASTEVLQRRFCNDVTKLDTGRTQYTMMLNAGGGVIDDLMVWRHNSADVWIMPNGTNHERVLRELTEPEVEIDDLRPETVCLAVQGPDAPEIIEATFGVSIRRGRVAEGTFGDTPVRIGGTGYTGERGGEIVGPPETMSAAFRALLAAGATPCGLGARDTLRLEAGLPLWGQDLTEEINPVQAGLGFAIAWDHDFVGREALLEERAHPRRQLVAFTTDSRQIPRHDNRLRAGESTGWVTSGNFSPTLGAGIGMGYLEPPTEDDIEVEIRDTWHPLRRVTPPFHR